MTGDIGLSWDVVIHLGTIAAGAVGVYAAIRTDIKLLHANIGHHDVVINEIKSDVKQTREKLSEHLERRATDKDPHH